MLEINKKVTVTSPALPDLGEFTSYLEKIWESKWITNGGKYHEELEQKLCEHLGVKHISLFSNGTLALITAIQALDLKGEIITTPFSFVATAHSIWWNKIKPVFVDVDEVYGNILPEEIEKNITDKTTAIMPVHVYGNPCEVDRIQQIADKYNLKVIYDAAHAFDVKIDGNSVLNFGDLSVLSFHATKVYNTIEGGAIICHSAEMKKHIDYLKNFGFEDETTVVEPGINAKMNEIISAYGLIQLKNVESNIKKREKIYELYHQKLSGIRGIRLLTPKELVKYNYSYYPIFIDAQLYGKTRDEVYYELQKHNIFGRRYFYPLITEFSPYNEENKNHLPNAKKVADQVICLPMYADLEENAVQRIANYFTNSMCS